MADKVTCCPQCKTSFRITDAQLSRAKGAVRCGSCLHVFKALDHLVAQAPATPQNTEPYNSEPSDEANQNPEEIEQQTFDASEDESATDELISDHMDDKQSTGSFGELSDDFTGGAGQSFQGGLFERKASKQQVVESQEDESWADDLLDDSAEKFAVAPKAEPVFQITDDDVEPITDASTDSQLFSLAKEATEEESEIRAESGHKHFVPEFDDAPVEMEWRAKTVLWPKRLLWGGASLVALLILALQIGWFNYDTLSRMEPYRSVYAKVCPLLNCRVPPAHDVTLIKSYNLVIRSHPEAENALAIDSILLNTAEFSQPFPKLMLFFSNLEGKPVAHRTFAPNEYLGGELAGAELMPSQQPIHISLEVVDPGKSAVNYQLAIVNH